VNDYEILKNKLTQFYAHKPDKSAICITRGVNVTESGEVILTAHRTNNVGDRIPAERACG